MTSPAKSIVIYGHRDGEHLRADIGKDQVLLVGAEHIASETGATQLRERFFCSVPKAVWLQVAEAIRREGSFRAL